jgi:hypothetical protein
LDQPGQPASARAGRGINAAAAMIAAIAARETLKG